MAISNNNESTTRIRNCDFEVAFDKMAVKSLANLKSRFDFQTIKLLKIIIQKRKPKRVFF